MLKAIFEDKNTKFIRIAQEAQGYHRRARLFNEQAQSASLVFNVGSIAIECYLLAICAWFGEMPFNHSYSSLMECAEDLIDFEPQLKADILSLDQIFGICSVDNYYHGAPVADDAKRVLAICTALSVMLTQFNITSVH